MSGLGLITTIIVIAVLFDFVNGFHDAANSVATVVATRVLSPTQAVTMAATFNFLAAALLGTSVATTVGRGFVNTEVVTPYVLLAGLLGAIVWNIFTWYFGLPISSSHALIGGYAGAALSKAGIHGLIVGKWPSTLAFIVLAPILGMVFGLGLMILVYRVFHRWTPARMDRYFRHAQLLSAALLSRHTAPMMPKNDGNHHGGSRCWACSKHLPRAVLGHRTFRFSDGNGDVKRRMACGKNDGDEANPAKPRSGFAAETGAAISILLATHLGLPVSTTHVVAGSIAGVGSIQRIRAVRWTMAATWCSPGFSLFPRRQL